MRPLARAGAALLVAAAALAGCRSEEPADLVQPAVAEPDLVEVGFAPQQEVFADQGLELSPLPADAGLTGPHHAVTLVGVVTTPELTREQLRALGMWGVHLDPDTPLQAGPEREFLLVYFGEPESGGVPPSDVPTAEVHVAGQARPLPAVPRPDEVLLLNVPVGEDATLVVTDAGEQTSISLRTGQWSRESIGDPAGSQHPADRLVGDRVGLWDYIRVPGLTPEDSAEVLTAHVEALAHSYLDDRGAPAEGDMWLQVEFELWANVCDWCVAGNATISLDLARSLSIRTSDGEELSIPADAPLELAIDLPATKMWEWRGFYEVPDTVRVLEVWYETHATFTLPDGGTLSYERVGGDTMGTLELREE